ncbi:MAG TPA: hypothetical protein VGA71_01695 [Actinomycetota bacterium]
MAWLIRHVPLPWRKAHRVEGSPKSSTRRPYSAALLTVAPVVLLLFWGTLATNERMWLPSEVITIHDAPVQLTRAMNQEEPCAGRPGIFDRYEFHPDECVPVAVLNNPPSSPPTKRALVLGYVLSTSDGSATIMTAGGGVFTLPQDHIDQRQVCQDLQEAHDDLLWDRPLIAFLPGFEHQDERLQTPICADFAWGIIKGFP